MSIHIYIHAFECMNIKTSNTYAINKVLDWVLK